MKTKLLLSHKFKKAGYIIAIPATVLIILAIYFNVQFGFLQYNSAAQHYNFDGEILFFGISSHNFTTEVLSIFFIGGLLLLAFSQEKFEDERISKIRLESLMWAVLINSLCIVLSLIIFYGGYFLTVMMYNLCTPLIIFIIRFNVVRSCLIKKC
jgi:uncharacterized membrane protein